MHLSPNHITRSLGIRRRYFCTRNISRRLIMNSSGPITLLIGTLRSFQKARKACSVRPRSPVFARGHGRCTHSWVRHTCDHGWGRSGAMRQINKFRSVAPGQTLTTVRRSKANKLTRTAAAKCTASRTSAHCSSRYGDGASVGDRARRAPQPTELNSGTRRAPAKDSNYTQCIG